MIGPIVEAWRINSRVTVYLAEALTPEQWAAPLGKGKCVRGQLSHMHNVRLMWLKASAPELMEGLEKLEGESLSQEEVIAALKASGAAVATLIEGAGSPDGRIKNFKPHATAFVAYMCAHEGFHRGHLELALRQAGMPLPDKVAYGTWEFGNFSDEKIGATS